MIGAMYETMIKYKKLDELLNGPIYSSSDFGAPINVIFDLKSFFRKAYRMKELDVEPMIAIEDISSSVINAIAHYRNYIYKYWRRTNFYLLYSEKECDQLVSEYPDYKKDYYGKYLHSDENKEMNQIIASALNRIKSIVKYIPNAFYLETSKLDEFVYLDIIAGKSDAPNFKYLILSDDPVMFQSLSSTSYAIDIKGINSKTIDSASVLDYLCESDKANRISGSGLLPLVLAMTGTDRYSIDGIKNFGFKRAIKAISDLVVEKILVETRYMVFPRDSVLKSRNKAVVDSIDLIERNYHLLLPIESEMKNADIVKSEIDAQSSKPVVTKKEFQNLNSRVFLNYPINVNGLLASC